MDRARFEAILAAYGADPKRWPAAEREAARAFAGAEEAAAEAAVIDRLLDLDAADEPVRLAAVRKALAGARRPPVTWRAAAALAACAALGLALGYGGGRAAPERGAADAVLAAAFGEGLEG